MLFISYSIFTDRVNVAYYGRPIRCFFWVVWLHELRLGQGQGDDGRDELHQLPRRAIRRGFGCERVHQLRRGHLCSCFGRDGLFDVRARQVLGCGLQRLHELRYRHLRGRGGEHWVHALLRRLVQERHGVDELRGVRRGQVPGERRGLRVPRLVRRGDVRPGRRLGLRQLPRRDLPAPDGRWRGRKLPLLPRRHLPASCGLHGVRELLCGHLPERCCLDKLPELHRWNLPRIDGAKRAVDLSQLRCWSLFCSRCVDLHQLRRGRI